MAIDLRQIAKAALDATGTEPPAPATPKKPHLSMGRALLLGAGLMTAGRLVAGPKARGVLESVQSRIEDSDWYRELEQPEFEDDHDDQPEAEAGEEFEDEEPYEDEDDAQEDEDEPQAEYDDEEEDEDEEDEDQYPHDEYERDEDFDDDEYAEPESEAEEDFDDEDEEDFDDEDDRPERPRSRRSTGAKQRSRA